MYPTVLGLASEPRGDDVSASVTRSGAKVRGMVNPTQRLINVVTRNKLKTLPSLSQNGKWIGVRADTSLTVDSNTTGEKSGPTPGCDRDGTR